MPSGPMGPVKGLSPRYFQELDTNKVPIFLYQHYFRQSTWNFWIFYKPSILSLIWLCWMHSHPWTVTTLHVLWQVSFGCLSCDLSQADKSFKHQNSPYFFYHFSLQLFNSVAPKLMNSDFQSFFFTIANWPNDFFL